MDKAHIEKEKVDRFISREQCRRIYLDQEIDGRTDCIRCEEGEERCNVCQNDGEAAAEAEALQQAYITEQDRMLDSSINMPSSSFEMPASDEATPSSNIHIQECNSTSNSSIDA